MNNFNYWHKRNSTIFNSVGHWTGGDDVIIENRSLMNDLMGNISYMQLHILNATGKLVEKNIADWIEVSLMGLSYPDSRIWCNQIAAYSSDTNTSVSAAAAISVLAADSRAYGGSKTTQICMQFLIEAKEKYENGLSIEGILKGVKFRQSKPSVVGFSRPIDRDDERLKPFVDIQSKLDIPNKSYLKFAIKLSDYLDEHFNLSINCGGYMSAFLLDQGFSPEQGYSLYSFTVISGAVGSFRSQKSQPSNSFLPMKCNDVQYIGVKTRFIE